MPEPPDTPRARTTRVPEPGPERFWSHDLAKFSATVFERLMGTRMGTAVDDVTRRWRIAMTGSADTPLVLLGNFEVEQEWARQELGLPRIPASRNKAIVRRMDEFALLLAGPDDHVVLKAAPDEEYLSYLAGLGIVLPRISAATGAPPDTSVTEDALRDPRLVAEMARAARRGARLWPHGVSEAEERLAARTALPLATPSARICKRVNSKIYSRLAADRLGLPQPPGAVCRTVEEFHAACDLARSWLAQGRAVAFKDAFGVSGTGILVVRDQSRLDHVRRMIDRQATRHGTARLTLVMEEWLAKRTDLNYQFTVGSDGSVHLDFVKEALTEAGVHKGHRMPALLGREQSALVRRAADALGAVLAEDGYRGVVGVDAIVTTDDILHPVLEINARNNMSTYQERLRHRFVGGDQAALATQHKLMLRRRLPFAEVHRRLADLLLESGRRGGVLLPNFATVNACAPAARTGTDAVPFEGRLYTMVVAATPHQAAALDQALRGRLGDVLAADSRPMTQQSRFPAAVSYAEGAEKP